MEGPVVRRRQPALVWRERGAQWNLHLCTANRYRRVLVAVESEGVVSAMKTFASQRVTNGGKTIYKVVAATVVR